MGTETKIDIDILQLYGIHLVKLNNPLMGTETGTPCPLLFQGF